MSNYQLNLENVSKVFGRRLVFSNINFAFESGKIYGIAGKNGSGKSTLAKIIAGLISPTKGKISHSYNGNSVTPEKLHNYLGFVSPYLVLYDEFTAKENLEHFAKIRGVNYNKERTDYLLERFNLSDRKNDLLKGFSSGMKQRMKFIFALQHSPKLLVFDEPTSNLDIPGKEAVYEIIGNEGKDNLVFIASNEESDLELCGEVINVEEYKNL